MKLLFIISILIASLDAAAQNKLEYVFDKNTDAEIQNFLKAQISKDSLRKFYFILAHGLTEKNFDNHVLFIGVYKDSPLEFVNNIIKTSSRFYKCDKTQIPISSDYDFSFIGYGRNKRGITRRNIVGEMFFIEFSNNDEIVRKGY